jgi:hypothetical protein
MTQLSFVKMVNKDRELIRRNIKIKSEKEISSRKRKKRLI